MTTLSQTDICNLTLAKIGAQGIGSLTDLSNTSAIACNNNWQLAFLEVARAHDWNCLKKAAVLAVVPQTPIFPPSSTYTSTPWAPLTAYATNVYVTYGGQLYQALIAHTSTASFMNDLTAGDWFQTDVLNVDPFGACGGATYESGWTYKYALPSDFVTMVALNDQKLDRYQATYEIMGGYLYTGQSQAVIKYVAALTDTTLYDALFTAALVFMLASRLATTLRQDSGSLAAQMLADYKAALRDARVKDANESTPRRFSPTSNSRIIASRWGSTNS